MDLSWLHREAELSHGEGSSSVTVIRRRGVSLDGAVEEIPMAAGAHLASKTEIILAEHLSQGAKGAWVSKSAYVAGAAGVHALTRL